MVGLSWKFPEAGRTAKRVGHRDLALRYGHDARAAALMYRSWSLWHLGYADQAIDAMDATLAWAMERDHGNTTGLALGMGGVITNVLMRRIPEVVAATRRCARAAFSLLARGYTFAPCPTLSAPWSAHTGTPSARP